MPELRDANVGTLAWNGVSLRLPAGWELTGVGKRLLQVSTGDGPAMDLKWSIVRGSFSFEKYLKRLRKGLAGGDAARLRALPADDALCRAAREALPDAEARAWALAGLEGENVLVLAHREASGLTLLALFHRRGRDIPRKAGRSVLGSLRDHHGEETTPYRIYDISADVPSDHALTGYVLRPGLYRLDFAAKGSALSLHRFAPADVILRGKGLEAWSAAQSAKFIRRHRLSAHAASLDADAGVDWRQDHAPGAVSRILARLTGRLPGGRLMLWQPGGSNILLGLEAGGRMALDAGCFDAARRRYVVLS